ncbi:restriction endonuclease subunit M [Desulfosporosinus fructosivorans]|uniref:site-specific DNA-methyltransferase (adenine-specific) n=1 Tax=Desulfosporosinus fructosivorans TaxID=2018669 RepID=A0A4Z0R840_9FIRM|nr:type I restriction-modification system subunit M N-terminal domain-containing protein [Desulfosporosinus fructosivorans]TGE38409.1 restriction endonuclease subunit M [Desulfosporosinus fructosivorans]
MGEKLTLAGLESFLDDTCDSLRKDRDAKELKEYVIAILFLKRLNDSFNLEREIRRNKLKAKGLTEAQIEDELEKREVYRFFVPKIARWKNIKHQTEELGPYLIKVFAEIEQMNRGCLGLLSTVDFNKRLENGDEYITNADLLELIKDFDELQLTDDHLAF